MHLLLLVLRRVKPTWGLVAAAILQTLILMFVVLCREEAAWQVMAVLAALILVIAGKPLLEAIRRPRLLRPAIRDLVLSAWPSIVMMVGVVSYFAYLTVMLDNVFYKTENGSRDSGIPCIAVRLARSGTLQALCWRQRRVDGSDGLRCGYGGPARSDEDLQKKPIDPAWKIAFRVNGVIYIDTRHDASVYDSLVRHIYLNILREHPWLVLKSFLVRSPYEELDTLTFTTRAHENLCTGTSGTERKRADWLFVARGS